MEPLCPAQAPDQATNFVFGDDAVVSVIEEPKGSTSVHVPVVVLSKRLHAIAPSEVTLPRPFPVSDTARVTGA